MNGLKRFAVAAICGAAIFGASVVNAVASPPNVNGTWKISQDGPDGSTMSTIKLAQAGHNITGSNGSNGTSLSGTFANDVWIQGTWRRSGSSGWLKVSVSPNGHSFNGTWGYEGKAEAGSFSGNEVLPPSPITAAGSWDVTVAGGPSTFDGTMKCTQSGPSVVCRVGKISIDGKFRANDKVRATWTNASGKSGWFSFWFNDDNNSFNGIWGNGAVTTPPAGRVVGQRSLGG